MASASGVVLRVLTVPDGKDPDAYLGMHGADGFRALVEEAPDLVLLDLAMPGPDGFSVIGRIRALGSAPVIVVSGESGEEAKVRALGLGADDYLTKPFGRAELLARIGAVMRRAEPGTTAAGSGPLRAGSLELEPRRHEARVDGRDRKSTRLNSSHIPLSRMPSSA